MNKSHFLLNKRTYLRLINKFHTKKYKLKYDDHLNNNLVGDIKLDYKVKYNWLNELIRVRKFDQWDQLVEEKCCTELTFYQPNDNMPKELSQFANLKIVYIYLNHIKKLPKELIRRNIKYRQFNILSTK